MENARWAVGTLIDQCVEERRLLDGTSLVDEVIDDGRGLLSITCDASKKKNDRHFGLGL